MAIQKMAIPTDESGFKVELAYLERWVPGTPNPTPLAFLARSGLDDEDSSSAAEAYRRQLPFYRRDFGEMLEDRHYSVVVSPPSNRRDLEPYRNEIVARGIAQQDLSSHFTLRRPTSARRQSFDELVGALDFAGASTLKSAESLLIVDDYFVTGRTAAALLSVIRSHGLRSEAEVTVACPLWLGKTD